MKKYFDLFRGWYDRHVREFLRYSRLERKLRRQMRALEKRMADAVAARQRECPHLQGCNPLSETYSTMTSIVWHFYDDQVWRGICTVCLRKFVPADKDFDYWFHQTSGNRPSAVFRHRETLREVGPPPSVTPKGDFKMTALDALSDEEVNSLMEGVRKIRKRPRRQSQRKEEK